MRLFARVVLACCLAAGVVPAVLARDQAPATAAQALVPFSLKEGLARLVGSAAKVDFPALANQFEPQSNGAFCGPTTTAIVLNTVRGRSADLRRDRSRLRAEDFQFAPAGFDPSVPRFTQDNVIGKGRRVEVGQPGGGQISPLGAFDAESDSVLVLDVNPASAGWVWMPVASLIRGLRTFDTVENRGYILVQSR
jgi:hypothetical protein